MDRDSNRSRGRREIVLGAAIALAFLTVGLVTLADRGLTWDEPESLLAGAGNLEVLRAVASGSTDFEWPWHELKGHQFVVDTLRVIVARAARPLVGGPEVSGVPGVPIRGFHLFHLLLATAALFLVYRLAADVSGSLRIGALAALLLATLPKLVAHSLNNPKDLVALFVYALFLWALERAVRRSGAGSPADLDGRRRADGGRVRLAAFVAPGAVLGLAFTSHVLSALLVPIGGAWLLYRTRRAAGWRDLPRIAAVLGLASGLATFVLWPWLWADPLVRTARAVRRVVAFPLDMEVLHIGRLYPAAELPREYFVVHLVAATPLFVLVAALAGAVLFLRWPSGVVTTPGPTAGPRRLAILALFWLGIPMGVEAFTSARYDGVRHLLCVLPALSILAALGLDALWTRAASPHGRSARRFAPRLAVVALLLAAAGSWLWTLVDLVRYHPYQDAYLNAATRRAIADADRRPESLFELEYWGAAYQEGAEWLRARAAEDGRDTTVFVPFGAWCAAPYAGPDVTVMGDVWLDGRAGDQGVVDAYADSPEPLPVPDYLMVIPRRAFMTPTIDRLRAELVPVHTARRMGATLLEVYRLTPQPPDE